MPDSNVKVAVRVRPMNQREINQGAECVVHMEGKRTVLKFTSPTYDGTCTAQKEFVFDHCFWSVNDEGPAKYTSQEDIFETLGKDLIDNIFAGFNSCIFAYGQTGSGKTFSMMGSDDQPGLVPRISSALFCRDISHLKSLQVEAAYLEIYNEKVRDLLHPTSNFEALKVREHKSLGPYVEGLSQHIVKNTKDIKSLINEGTKYRKTASTKMNEQSSRSHAIFTLTVTQTLQNEHGAMKELLSKVSLVDLAGSERTSKTGATGDRMKESKNINKSLTSLGLVINSLAELSEGRRKSSYVNYRDSVLTWLLKNNLGGNSKTVMLATISPASVDYQETLSTLKYAESAKRIVNKATVNEDIKSKAIEELKDEIRRLREQLLQTEEKCKKELEAKLKKSEELLQTEEKYKHELEAKLKESEKLLQELNVSWEEKLKKTETSAVERQKHLQRLGITVEDSGIRVNEEKCYLINLSSGISNQKELLLYHLGERTKIGAGDSQDIQVTGPGVKLEHCVIDIKQDGEVFLTPNKNAETYVNGSRVQTVVMLSHEDKIEIGDEASFMIRMPKTEPNFTHKQGNKSIHEECNKSISSDNIQWSHKENTDSSVSKCPSYKAREQKISNENNVSKESDDNADISINLQTVMEGNRRDHNQISKDDRTEISINPTSQAGMEGKISDKNEVSKEDDKRRDRSIDPTSQTGIEQNVKRRNQISEDKSDLSINPISQTGMEGNRSGKNEVSKEDDKRRDSSTGSTSQTGIGQNIRSQSQISPSDDHFIEDDLISRSENIPGNYDTSEGHKGASMGGASPLKKTCKSSLRSSQRNRENMGDLGILKEKISTYKLEGSTLGNLGYKRILLQVCGFCGHGKSSFINSIKYALHGGKFSMSAPVAQTEGGLTRVRAPYPLTEVITIVDNRGFGKSDSYEREEVYAQLANLQPLNEEEVNWNRTFKERMEAVLSAELNTSDLIVPIFIHSVGKKIPEDEKPEIIEFLKNMQDLTGLYYVQEA